MALSPPIVVNDWWVSTAATGLGSTHLNPSVEQIHNAYKVRAQLLNYGFSETAISGILGNMQKESGLSPGAIQKRSVCPNNADSVTDVPNSVMIDYYDHNDPTNDGYGIGLIQWDSYTPTAPAGCALVSFAIRYDYNAWYDGDCQTDRINFEYLHDATGAAIPIGGQTYNWWTVYRFSGIDWTYTLFRIMGSNYTPGTAADVYRACRVKPEYDATSAQQRRENAAFWYQYFQDHPVEQTPPWLLLMSNNANKKKVVKNVQYRN